MQEKFELIKDAVWLKLQNGIADKLSESGFWENNKIELSIKDWVITLDSYTVNNIIYTRLRTPYENRKRFIFKIFRKGFFTNFIKLFGMQDIEIGDFDFDQDFIIQSNDKSKVQLLFANPHVRDLISAQPSIFIHIKNDEGYFKEKFPYGTDELYLEVATVITNIHQLENIYRIFTKILMRLEEIN